MGISKKRLFFSMLTGSDRTVKNYKAAIGSSYIKNVLTRMYGKSDLFEFTDLEELWKVYCFVNLDDTNIRNHRIYSAAIMKYIRFLNHGEKYGHKRGLGKPLNRKKGLKEQTLSGLLNTQSLD